MRSRKRSYGKGVLKNKFETKLQEELNSLWGKDNVEYEKIALTYTVPESKHKYTPDFRKKKTDFYIEGKGYWKPADRKKMLLVKEQHPELRICMYFVTGDKPIRKGSKTTYGMFCDKHGIEWSDLRRGIPKDWK